MWRRLQALGAVAIKNSAYVLPRTDQAREDFEWVLREIIKQGGEASLCEARFVDGLRDDQVEALFNAARDAEYGGIVAEARRVADNLPSGEALPEGRRPQLEAEVARLKRRLAEVSALDFFGAPGREAADGLVASLAARAQRGLARMADGRQLGDLHGRTWVTRKGIHIDRIASAWLIRRFVDPGAAFKFVPARSYRPEPGELRFDMFEAEFTHEGDLCTFEVLLARVRLDDPALRPIAAIVHDIDLKDAKFDRPEAAGIDRLIAGLAMRHREDEDRLARGAAVFDDLYEYFRRKRA